MRAIPQLVSAPLNPIPITTFGGWLLLKFLGGATHQKAANVKFIHNESLTKQSIFVESIFSRRSIWVLLEFIRRWTQHLTKIDQEKRKIEQICIWSPMTTGFIMYTYIDFPHQYGIFCRWVADVPSRETSLSGDERGETSAFRRLLLHISNTGHNVSSYITEEIIENIRSLAECGRIFSPALQIQRTRKAFQIQDSDYYWCLLLSLQTAWSWLPLYSNYLVLASQLWAKSRPRPPTTPQAMKFHVFIRTTPMNIVVENLYLASVSVLMS